MAVDLARSVAECGVERIIYTDIARDGMLGGPNIEQTLAVLKAANVRVTASGGVSSLDDIKRLRDAGDARSTVLSLAKLYTKESSFGRGYLPRIQRINRIRIMSERYLMKEF